MSNELKLNHPASMFRTLTLDVLEHQENQSFTRFLKAFYRVVWNTSLKGKSNVDIKIKNEKNKPTGETYAKLKTYFELQGFKFIINVDKDRVMYTRISW
jgi:hypothetical protein